MSVFSGWWLVTHHSENHAKVGHASSERSELAAEAVLWDAHLHPALVEQAAQHSSSSSTTASTATLLWFVVLFFLFRLRLSDVHVRWRLLILRLQLQLVMQIVAEAGHSPWRFSAQPGQDHFGCKLQVTLRIAGCRLQQTLTFFLAFSVRTLSARLEIE